MNVITQQFQFAVVNQFVFKTDDIRIVEAKNFAQHVEFSKHFVQENQIEWRGTQHLDWVPISLIPKEDVERLLNEVMRRGGPLPYSHLYLKYRLDICQPERPSELAVKILKANRLFKPDDFDTAMEKIENTYPTERDTALDKFSTSTMDYLSKAAALDEYLYEQRRYQNRYQ